MGWFGGLVAFYLVDVCDEANLEAHGALPMGRFAMDSVFRGAILDRVGRMAARDKNHACVVLWSLGNESGAGPSLLAARDALRAYDAGVAARPVQYEGGGGMLEGGGESRLTDVVCPMYASPHTIVRQAAHGSRPVILCEFAHAMGNSTGGLCKYVSAFEDDALPSCQGGFIWDWCDQGLVLRRDRDDDDAQLRGTCGSVGGDTPTSAASVSASTSVPFVGGNTGRSNEVGWCWGYGGDFGRRELHDGPFCMNGLVDADRRPHPAMAEVKYLFQPCVIAGAGRAGAGESGGRFVWVLNRFSFRTLEPRFVHFKWRLQSDARTLAEGTVSRFEAVPPGRAGLMWLPHGPIADAPTDVPERYVWLGVDMVLAPSSAAAATAAAASSSSADPYTWAGDGHILAIEQIMISGGATASPRSAEDEEREQKCATRMRRHATAAALKMLEVNAAREYAGLQLSSSPSKPALLRKASTNASPICKEDATGGLSVAHDHNDSGGAVVRVSVSGQPSSSYVEISRDDGSVRSMVVHGKPVLVAPDCTADSTPWAKSATTGGPETSGGGEPRTPSMHCLFRAPTCNDRGGIRELLGMLVGEKLGNRLAPYLAPFLGWYFRTFEPFRGPLAGASYEAQVISRGVSFRLAFSQSDVISFLFFFLLLIVAITTAHALIPISCDAPRILLLQWFSAGLDDLSFEGESCSVVPLKRVGEKGGKAFSVRVEVLTVARKRNGLRRSVASVSTTIDVTTRRQRQQQIDRGPRREASGMLEVAIRRRVAVAPWVPPLPRVGLRFAAPAALCTTRWLGRGPHENYPDRHSGAHFGVHGDDDVIAAADLPAAWSAAMSSLSSASSKGLAACPYARPQEYGGHSDTVWLALLPRLMPKRGWTVASMYQSGGIGGGTEDRPTDEEQPGLLIRSDLSFQSSVLPHSLEDLTRSEHAFDLDPLREDARGQGSKRGVASAAAGDGLVHVHVDPWMMGIGGDDSWSPRVHAEFLLKRHKQRGGERAYENTVWLTALAPGESPQAAALQPVPEVALVRI